MPPLAAVLPAIGSFLASNVLPIAMGVGSMGMGMLQGQQQQKAAEKSQKKAMATWQQTAYPSPTAVGAEESNLMAKAAQQRLGATKNIASELAGRGFGSGSGLMAERVMGINQDYLGRISDISTQMAKLRTAGPFWGPPSAAYGIPTSGALEAGMGKGSSMLDTAMGFYMMKNLFGGLS